MPSPDAPAFDYGPVIARLRDGELVPFLGAAASFRRGPGAGQPQHQPQGLPDASRLARELLEGITYPGPTTDPLTKVAQYVEEGPADRRYLLGTVGRRFHDALEKDYTTAFNEFLNDVPEELIPPLIITTNYDVLVERALEQRNVKYLAMSQVTRGGQYAGRWLCYSKLDVPLSTKSVVPLRRLEEELKAQQISRRENGSRPVIWVYKIHGTARVKMQAEAGEELLDSIVLTEADYIDFLSRDVLKTMPAQLAALLRRSSLLFLGYSLTDWNFRVLLQRIRQLQLRSEGSSPRHWAFLLNVESVEEQFWRFRGVNVHALPLEDCLQSLRAALRAR
jgi:hypothetical protein